MNLVRAKKNVWFPLILMLVVSVVMISVPVQASPTVRFYVDPEVRDAVAVDTDVYVNVTIESPPEWENTSDGIVGWRLYVEVDPAVLEPVEVISGDYGYFLYDFTDDYGYLGTEVLFNVDKAGGRLWDVSEFLLGWEELGVGAGGSGLLCTLRFKSKSAIDYSLIDLYNTFYDTIDAKISVDIVEDGHYKEPGLIEADLVRRKAWPEHRSFARSRDGDKDVYDKHGTPGNQTLYGRVKNLGTVTFNVTVKFELLKGFSLITIEDERDIAPGQTIDFPVDFSGLDGYPWEATDDSTWEVKVTCRYYDYMAKSWESGEHIKTFFFHVFATTD